MSLLLFCFGFISLCPAQSRSILCTDGTGSFAAAFYTKVHLRVGATKKVALAVRSCEASFDWNDRKLVVASDIPVLDLDAFGINLGLGTPVAAFQTKKSKDDCCMTYQVYSLQKPPTLLRQLTGGSYYSSADTDLDGQVEIWTDDAAAFNGFDNLALAELDFAPPLVLRFEKGKLMDVTSEFSADLDKQIGMLRSQLRAEDLLAFKNSDGKLQSPDSSLSEKIHLLRGVKAKVLEIVWSYLYSGREEEAWHSLAELWPASDAERIRQLLVKTRVIGMHTQLDGTSTSPIAKKTVEVFPATSSDTNRAPELYSNGSQFEVQESESLERIIPPTEITVRSFPTVGATDRMISHGSITVTLLIDSAGKVRSATPLGSVAWKNLNLMSALSEWKFVPAFKGHRAVASTIVKIFSPQQ
jgi:hypothetical protein